MPLLKTGLFGLLLFVCVLRATAQANTLSRDAISNSTSRKQELFHDLPKRMSVNQQLLAPLLQKELGAPVRVSLASGFELTGIVVSKSDAAEERYKTVVIRATNRPGATFAITGVRKNDGSYRYSGRMLSLKSSDAYELVEEKEGFVLQKRDASELVTE